MLILIKIPFKKRLLPVDSKNSDQKAIDFNYSINKPEGGGGCEK